MASGLTQRDQDFEHNQIESTVQDFVTVLDVISQRSVLPVVRLKEENVPIYFSV